MFQRVLFLLRGAPSEVHLLICRPGSGVLCDADNNTLVRARADKHSYCRDGLGSSALDLFLFEEENDALFLHTLHIKKFYL